MDQSTTTPQVTTPTLPKDIALPETPAPSHFLKQEGLEHSTKEEEEAEIVSTGEEEQVLGEQNSHLSSGCSAGNCMYEQGTMLTFASMISSS